MQAYAEALKDDPIAEATEGSPLPPGSPAVSHHSVPNSARVRKVAALSDFAPINLRVKRCVTTGLQNWG